MQRAALYIRVSTDDQVEYSPSAQKNSLIQFAKKNDMLVSDEHIFVDEGISGRKAEKRPGFMRMISTAKIKPKPFDVILVHKNDRFARNREDSVVYKSLLRKDCGIKVISITEQFEDDKFSIIMESMLEAMAEYYSLNLADEVKKGLTEKARRGERVGKAPYGYIMEEGKLLPHEEEFNIVRMIFDLFVSKNYTIAGLTSYLNENKFRTKRGSSWTSITLNYIIANPIYMGVNRYNYRKRGSGKPNPPEDWILTPSNNKPVIDEKTFNLAQKKLLNSRLFFKKDYNDRDLRSWLQRIIKCPKCGSSLTVSTSKQTYIFFRCAKANVKACDMKSTTSARILEKLVLKQIKMDIDNNNLLAERIHDKNQLSELDLLNNQLQKIQSQYELLKNAYLAQIDTIDEYKKNKEQLYKKENELINKIELLSSNEDKVLLDTLKIQAYYKILENETISNSEKNKILRSFVKKIDANLAKKELVIFYYF